MHFVVTEVAMRLCLHAAERCLCLPMSVIVKEDGAPCSDLSQKGLRLNQVAAAAADSCFQAHPTQSDQLIVATYDAYCSGFWRKGHVVCTEQQWQR